MDRQSSPSSIDRSSSSVASDDPMLSQDVERNIPEGGTKGLKQQGHITFYKIPIPFRNGYLASDAFKLVTVVAVATTALCIFQFIYIQRLQAGLIRIDNDNFDNVFWKLTRHSESIWDTWRQSMISNAYPVPVHSHNDYWQRLPLFEALGSGCISVEADVHLYGSELFVGHTSADNTADTLRSMYLEPLQRMLKMRNAETASGEWRGIFNRAPQQTVVLLVDVKTNGPETVAQLYDQLQALRDLDYLTYWNGTDRIVRPLTIVASGNAPLESITALNATHRDILWDAPLDRLRTPNDDVTARPPVFEFNTSNSYFASTEWRRAHLFNLWNSSDPPTDLRIREAQSSQIEQARARGLVARYWDTPTSPPNLRDVAWRVLMKQKVGVLNMDDMGTVRERAGGWGNIEL